MEKHGGAMEWTEDEIKRTFDLDNSLSEGDGILEEDYHKVGIVMKAGMAKAAAAAIAGETKCVRPPLP